MLKPLALDRVYRSIEPGPVVLLLTRAEGGAANVMTMSWHMMVDFVPPQIACVVSAANHSFAALQATRACVIAIPPAERAADVVAIGNCSGRDTDKFARLGLATRPASKVDAPLLEGMIANLECKVVDTRLVSKFNLFVLQVVAAWRETSLRGAKTMHHQGYGAFVLDGERIKLRSAKP